jgi:hypothetical protein
MKNNLPKLAFLLPFLFILFSFHQVQSQTEFGLKGGILFSNIDALKNNSNVDFENKNGLTFGVFYKKNLFGPVSIQTELLYQLKGANYFIEKYVYYNPADYSAEEYSQLLNAPKSYYKDKEHLHYFSLPVLFQLKTTKFLDLYAGPELGYLFSRKSNWEETGNLNRFSTGFAGGATLKLSDKTKMDFRYSRDLTKFDTLDKNSSIDLKNHGFSVTLQQTLFGK